MHDWCLGQAIQCDDIDLHFAVGLVQKLTKGPVGIDHARVHHVRDAPRLVKFLAQKFVSLHSGVEKRYFEKEDGSAHT